MRAHTITTVLVTALLITARYAAAQGSLTPPGAPAPTMKTLEQIEPRIDAMTLAGDPNSEIMIANSGSYYLSANLEVGKPSGISIAATDVVLDLNGFTISRVSGSSGYGVFIGGGMDRATVRNGSIVGFQYGIWSYSSPAYPKAGLFEKLAVSGCSEYGIRAGISSRIVDCRAHDNSGTGIRTEKGSSLVGCTAYKNSGVSGIHAGFGSSLVGCVAYENTGFYGIYADAGSSLHGCVARGNNSVKSSNYGIFVLGGSTVVECSAYGNSNTNSSGSSVHGVGIYADDGSIVKDCAVSINRGDGIYITEECMVLGNTCRNNGYSNGDGAGIHATGSDNRIDGNNVTNNDRGIDVDSAGNLIVRNSLSGNGTQLDIVGGNDTGTFQASPVGAGAWDNFSF